MNKTYYNRKAEGRCVICGKQTERTMAGKTRCEDCTKDAVKAERDRNNERREKGLCIWCLKKTDGRLCPDCRKMERQYAKQARQWRKELTRRNVNGII